MAAENTNSENHVATVMAMTEIKFPADGLHRIHPPATGHKYGGQ